jgi:hypothetical protein
MQKKAMRDKETIMSDVDECKKERVQEERFRSQLQRLLGMQEWRVEQNKEYC